MSEELAPRILAGEALAEPWATRAQEVKDWLVREGAFAPHVGVTLEGLAEKLLAAGIPLARATTHFQALHSERIGVTRIWQRGEAVRELHFPHGARTGELYQRSPIKVVHETLDWVSLRLADTPDDTFGIVADLKTLGLTHYVIAPMVYTNETRNAVSWATDRPNGFDADHMRFFRAILPTLTLVLELRVLYRTVNEVLRIYVGREPGERILAGQVQRGEVTRIRSAILVCDMRNFTGLSLAMTEEEIVVLLNHYLDCVIPAIESCGGEVLKFLGDGVLAIFPEAHDSSNDEPREEVPPPREEHGAVCEAALAAAEAINRALEEGNRARPAGMPEIRAGIALHYGHAAYGNIGSGERLDFTVIGQDVNLTSRIADLCTKLNQPVLLSQPFADAVAQPTAEVGSYPLKGFADLQTICAPV